MNPRSRSVENAGRAIELTAKEFDLLYFLARHPGQVFSREQLLDQVWDYEYIGDASTVTVHVRDLASSNGLTHDVQKLALAVLEEVRR